MKQVCSILKHRCLVILCYMYTCNSAQTDQKLYFALIILGTVFQCTKRYGKVHPCTGTEDLCRPYSPQGE